MASKSEKSEAKKTDIPEGFESVGTPDIDGWWKVASGNTIVGRLVGHLFIRNQKPEGPRYRAVLLVELQRETQGTDSDGNDLILKVGQVAAVGVRAKLADLLDYVESKPVVFIKPVEERKLKGGRKMWLFDVAQKGGRKGHRPMPPAEEAVEDVESSDDVPF